MQQRDRSARKMAEQRNRLESLVYEQRAALGEDAITHGDGIGAFATEKERAALSAELDKAEEWLYSDAGVDASADTYGAKSDALDSLGAAASRRREAG